VTGQGTFQGGKEGTFQKQRKGNITRRRGKNVRLVPGTNRTLPVNRAFGGSNFLQKCPLSTRYGEDILEESMMNRRFLRSYAVCGVVFEI